jgi:hypothetical protein
MASEWLERAIAPYRSVRIHGRSIDELLASSPFTTRPDLLRSLALVVLRPDAIASGRASDVLDCLAETERIVPLMLRVSRLGASGFDKLYRFKLHLFGDSVWLHHEIFEAGPAGVVVVTGNAGAAETLCERVNGLKGASSPLDERTPPSLRERFGRASAFHAVIHVSEDVGAFVYELCSLFTPQEVEQLAKRCGGVDDTPSVALKMPLCRALLSPEPASSASVFEHAFSVKRRIAAARVLDRPDDHAKELWRMTDHAHSTISGTYSDQRAAFTEFVDAERPLLARAIDDAERALPSSLAAFTDYNANSYLERWRTFDRSCDPLLLLYASACLSGVSPVEPEFADRLWHVLERNNVPVSNWQRTLLLAGLRADLTGNVALPGGPTCG